MTQCPGAGLCLHSIRGRQILPRPLAQILLGSGQIEAVIRDLEGPADQTAKSIQVRQPAELAPASQGTNQQAGCDQAAGLVGMDPLSKLKTCFVCPLSLRSQSQLPA